MSIRTRSPQGVDPAPAMLRGNTRGLFRLGFALGSGFGAGAASDLESSEVRALGSEGGVPLPLPRLTHLGLGLIPPLAPTHALLGSGSR